MGSDKGTSTGIEESVMRIMLAIILEVEADFPYDVLGVNHNISADNIKKRYWKLSILVHPDKCPHPLAHQAFIKLNKSLKELQDPDKFGMTMQSTIFSKSSKARRGDTSVWTDTPSERAQKAKMNYLEAYNEAAALASNEVEKKRKSSDADLVDKYNKVKRSKSLVQKHQEEATSRSKKKTKLQPEKEQWVRQHPWKPGDRNKDLGAGRKNIKLYSKNMAEGLTSRFSSGNVQRSFL